MSRNRNQTEKFGNIHELYKLMSKNIFLSIKFKIKKKVTD